MNLHMGAGSMESIVGCKICVIKGTVCNSGGNDHQRVGNRADRTVAATIADNNLIRALKLCGICSRSTAIQFHCIHAAKAVHDFCLFLVCHTDGIRRLVAVSNHQYNIAVRLDTDSRTRILGLGKTITDLAVLDQHRPTADCFLYGIGILTPCALAADHGGAVLHNCEEIIGITGIVAVDIHAFHYKRTGRLTCADIVIGCISRCDNIVTALCLCGVCLLYNRGFSPVAGVVVVMVVCLDKNIRIGRNVCVDNIVNDAIAVFVIRNNLGFLDARGELGTLFGSGSQRLFILCRKCRHGNERHKHKQAQNSRQCARKSCFHILLLYKIGITYTHAA